MLLRKCSSTPSRTLLYHLTGTGCESSSSSSSCAFGGIGTGTTPILCRKFSNILHHRHRHRDEEGLESGRRRGGTIPGFHQKATFITLPGTGGGNKLKEYSERRILGFSMEQMYQVVSDVEHYQEFLPWCQKSHIRSKRKGHVTADLVVGFPPLLESYTSHVTLSKPNMIKAESRQGRLFNHLVTNWKFGPGLKDKPQSSVVDFYVSFEFKSTLTSHLANVFFNEVVRTMAGAFYNEAKRRYGRESVPSRKIQVITNEGGPDKS